MDVARSLRIDVPKVAFLSASESVLKFASSQEAAVLAGMAVRKQFGAIIGEGPISIDCALFPDACQIKGFTGRIRAMRMSSSYPNIESGNVFYKVLVQVWRRRSRSHGDRDDGTLHPDQQRRF